MVACNLDIDKLYFLSCDAVILLQHGKIPDLLYISSRDQSPDYQYIIGARQDDLYRYRVGSILEICIRRVMDKNEKIVCLGEMWKGSMY
jgi:hypothetical protein